MAELLSASGVLFDAETQVLVIGAGACGLTAALKAADAGAQVLVLERDASPSGSTSMSSGFIPAAGTRFQHEAGIKDDAALFAADIQKKAKNRAEPTLVATAIAAIGPALEWLADRHGLEWQVLDGFLYPGHSCTRMHAVPEKTGAALMARLLAAAENAGVPVVTDAHVETLYVAQDGRITGVGLSRPDGTIERIGCHALILASSGFAGNAALVASHIPEMAGAPVYAHPGNRGEALGWGAALGAATACLSACQGHGSLAHPHGILITWALMMEGGIQVNALGQRFSNEHRGYSEQSTDVLAQPGAVAWCLFDARLHKMAQDFPDFREAEAAGAVKTGSDAAALAKATGLPEAALLETLAQVAALQGGAVDSFGRDFTGNAPLAPPYYAVKVTGALFHTQGGLMIDGQARVLRQDGTPFPNLFAGGGAACGVSGPELSGYLSGNGLLTAIGFGAVAGETAGGLASTA